MKIKIEITDGLPEDEVVIRCSRMDENIQRIHQYILDQNSAGPKLVFTKQGEEYYFPTDEILFFEVEGENVYAHTKDDAYRVRYRLYELEDILPGHFVRASKSTIVNINKIYAIKRDLTSSSMIQFAGTHKNIYASRHYYRALKARINERSNQP